MSGEEYREEFCVDRELSSESYRAAHFRGRSIAGIAHWERLWSRHYVTDWFLRLHEEDHDLNFYHVVKIGQMLATNGWALFGSWDKALRSAGLDPAVLRVIPPHRHWTRSMAIEGLRNFAKLKKKNCRREMSNHLRMAITRFFGTSQEACRAAGLDYEEINPRTIILGEPVAKLVAAIRALENLKGRERRTKLDAICIKNEVNHRIIVGHFGSLRKLAAKVGIAPRVVAPSVYRDEADVQHDLDLLEREGTLLTYGTLKHGNRRLYNVIWETGWGAERLTQPPILPTKFPPCNPRSGLLRDRMIILRRRLRISIPAAAEKAGLCKECWANIEKDQVNPSATSIEKIERLLVEHQIPISTAPHTPSLKRA